MAIQPGQQLLHYQVAEQIGEGGMGVVWKAVDTTLDRTVAIKLLPDTFGQDPERLARFEREAKSLAALNHPNVASLFGLHEADGIRFLSMELVEGEDLARRLQRGAIPVEEAIPIAIGIAEALSAAHAQGIVHRDLKPANVLLDAEGTPKVLDFGLAKTVLPDTMSSGGSDSSASPTMTSFGTVAGMLMGTAAYMSPEQARGKPVDKRADTWALCCVLFEMLSGTAPFAGETVSDTLAGVLRAEPDWSALPSSVSPTVKRILQRGLTKNLRDRWQDAGDLRHELERALDAPETSRSSSSPADGGRKLTPLAIGLLLAGLVLGTALSHVLIRPATPADRGARDKTISEISAAADVYFGVQGVDLALSPDGSQLAYAAIDPEGRRRLYIRSLTGGTVKELPGTEDAREPFWSPDGVQIGFHTPLSMKRMGLDDAQPTTIAEVAGASGTWNQQGTVLFCSNNVRGVKTMEVETGEVGSLDFAVTGNGNCDSVAFLPDGEHFLFESRAGDEPGIYVASLRSEGVKPLIQLKTNAVYSAGHLLFHDGPRLMAQAFDTETLEFTDDPVVVANPVFETNFPFHALFTAARDRPRVVYLEGTGESLQTELVWFDREGTVVERTGIIGDLYSPRLSRDGRRVLVDVSTYETEGDIWLYDLARGSSRRLTDHPFDESYPQWSPDERAVYFHRGPDLYKLSLEGDGEPVVLHANENLKRTSHVSIDGTIAFTESGETLDDISYYNPASDEAFSWLASPADEENAQFSPDGKWLAYESDESGRVEIYVDRFPQRTERFQVSRGGGSNPRFSADGNELYYVSLTRDLVAVPMDLASEDRPIDEPQVLFRPKIRRDMFEPHPSGRRFLIVTRLDPEINRAILVDDWN